MFEKRHLLYYKAKVFILIFLIKCTEIKTFAKVQANQITDDEICQTIIIQSDYQQKSNYMFQIFLNQLSFSC